MSTLHDVSSPVSSRISSRLSHRFAAVDALRGAVMVIMALDHVRDFVHIGAMSFSPEDLSRTSALLFLTRWITHICAPTFMFTAGIGAGLRLQRDGSRSAARRGLSRFLLTRGLWLVIVEVTVMRLALNFNLSFAYPVLLLVLWALGISMMLLAALIWLPVRWLAIISIAIIALHNMLDGIPLTGLHTPGAYVMGGIPGLRMPIVFVFGYPIVPWFAVMALGFCIAPLLLDASRRRRVLVIAGIASIVGFVALRALNVYGDPSPWSAQSSTLFTVLSFLRTTKYPPSLQFLLMTLGPAMLLLAYFDWRQPSARHPLVIIGRVPFFYFISHFYLGHIAALLLAIARYGTTAFGFLFLPFPSVGGPRAKFPDDFGNPLWVAYVVWMLIVIVLYPACRWFADVKARHRDWWWLSYL
jgi:uncharacterized membrane protein